MTRHLIACAAVLLAGCSPPAPTSTPPAAAAAAPQAPASPAATAAAPQAPASPAASTPASAPAASAAPAAAPVSAAPAASSPPLAPPAPPAPPEPVYKEIVIPTGTTLSIELRTALASDTSTVEQDVHGVLRRPVVVGGVEVVPAGAAVSGSVTAAERSARVKGRARLALRFTSIAIDGAAEPISTAAISRQAQGTKGKDAAKIGIGAGAGALIGAIAGGGSGAAIGGTIGGAAGTGAVLATRGAEVELHTGTPLSTTLTRPLTVRVRQP